MPAREGAARFARFSVYAAAYSAVILTFALVWAKYKYDLYLPRDGEYNLWLAQTYRDWANTWDITSFNPLQGMTSMLVAINPYFNPGHWAFFSGMPTGVAIIASYCIYVLELLVSTFLLGRALGFSPTFSFAASLWLSLLLVPPFNYTFSFLGWLSGAPMYGHALALSNLLAVVFVRLGDAGTRSVVRNLLFVLGFLALLLALLLGGPFYYAGLVPGIALLLACIFASSNTRGQVLWRIATGVALVLVFYLFGVLDFLGSSRIYSDRFTGAAMLQLNLPTQFTWPSEQALSGAYAILCAWGLICVPFPGRPLAIGSYWVHAAIIAGGILVYRQMPLPASRVGLCLSLIWMLILAVWLAASFGLITIGMSPVFVYLALFPLGALMSLYAISRLLLLVAHRLRLKAPRPFNVNPILVVGTAFCVLVIAVYGVRLRLVRHIADRLPQHQTTDITEFLRREIALRPGATFRGYAATVFGSPEGTLRTALGIDPTALVMSGQFEQFLSASATSGNSHELMGLWAFNIPTISEYGQGISRPLRLYATWLLSTPGDGFEPHFIFPRLANIDVLRAMGVRFVIVDKRLSGANVVERVSLPLKNGATLFVYELLESNLGTYSPTSFLQFPGLAAFIGEILRDPGSLETRAFVQRGVQGPFVPARDARLRYEKGGVHVTATSTGRSTLLLPVQFSHCYRLESASGNVSVMRANVIHTLVVFDGALDLRLRWRFGPFGDARCRQEDIRELKALELIPM